MIAGSSQDACVRLQVTTTAPVGVGTPVISVGFGQTQASSSTPTKWDLIDNNVTPLRGIGTFDLDIVGGGTRLGKGDQLGLLVYGLQDQRIGERCLADRRTAERYRKSLDPFARAGK